MAELKDFTGLIVYKIKVIKRVENFIGSSDSRSQWLIECLLCSNQHKIVGRDLVRYGSRFKKGCYKCPGFNRKPKGKFRYGKNINGFTDKSIIIPIED